MVSLFKRFTKFNENGLIRFGEYTLALICVNYYMCLPIKPYLLNNILSMPFLSAIENYITPLSVETLLALRVGFQLGLMLKTPIMKLLS